MMPDAGAGGNSRWRSSLAMGQAMTSPKRAADDNKTVTAMPPKSGVMGLSSSKKMSMASALVGEKLAHLRADLRLGLYRLAHPVLAQDDRAAAQESNIVQKSVATERRRQQEARARAVANEKRLAKRKAQAAKAGYSSPL